jgi:hypothetical protein
MRAYKTKMTLMAPRGTGIGPNPQFCDSFPGLPMAMNHRKPLSRKAFPLCSRARLVFATILCAV